MKTSRYIALFALVVVLLVTFGDRGLLDNFRKNEQLMAIKKTNHTLDIENRALKRNITLLRNDLSFIEMTARNELGMVRKGDLVYRKGR